MIENIEKNPIHLGLGATASTESEFTGMEWYADYAKRHEADGKEGRLVSMYTFDRSWDVWEMHPFGSEVVLCIKGRITLIQDIDGQEKDVVLNASEYAINPAGVWHTANLEGEASVLFITAGAGTEHKPRD